MDYHQFINAIEEGQLPGDTSEHMEALFEDAVGNWEKAHEIAQDIHDPMGSLIHAYLHRKEGDEWNANYWYNKAGRKMPEVTLKSEWESIAKEILEQIN